MYNDKIIKLLLNSINGQIDKQVSVGVCLFVCVRLFVCVGVKAIVRKNPGDRF